MGIKLVVSFLILLMPFTPKTDKAVQKEIIKPESKIKNISIINIEGINVEENVNEYVTSFVEKEFVNSDKYNVVERRKIKEIMEEQEFWQRDFISKENAMEVGKLAHVDVLVIGSIVKFGDEYQLSLRLISTVDGEILGSATATATEMNDIGEMCEDVVANLLEDY